MSENMQIQRVESNGGALMAVSGVVERLDAVHQLMKQAMKKDEDYGVIPGTGSKPTLLKPGSEKLCTLFRLSPTYHTDIKDLPDVGRGHREYIIVCTLTHIPTQAVWGQAMGSCSTAESKYRWRKGERKCPSCGAAAIIKGKAEYGGGFVCFGKKGGCGAKFADDDKAIISQETGRKENDDIADQYNTVLKMATKRALVAAVLITTGASASFTQDVEDMMIGGDDAMDAIATPKAPPKPAIKQPVPAESTVVYAPIHPGDQQFEDYVNEVESVHSGASSKKPWTRFDVTCGDTKLSTFSSTIAAKATAAKAEGVKVQIVWRDQNGHATLIDVLPIVHEGELVG
jgi:hypothetical protein